MMDNNDWRPPPPGPGGAFDAGEAVPDGDDWRKHLDAESRHRIVNKIMETLKRRLSFSGSEGLQELRKIAVRFEEKIFADASSQSDYLRRISLKMMTMESKSQNLEGDDWRKHLAAESRHRIVNKIMETLKRHLPFSGPEGLQELRKVAIRFEEKIFHGASSQPDYLKKISLKMLAMESKSQNSVTNPMPSNSAGKRH